MSDLAIGLIIMTLLCVALFRIGLRVGRFYTPLVIRILAVCTVAAVLAYHAFLWDNPVLARLLPFSNLILVGNWFPLGAALLGGLIFDLLPGPRRSLMLNMLAGVGAFCLVYPLLGSAPACREEFDAEGRCVQTTDATCSAACAASLLRSYGIETTEQEMADLCLTRQGTRWQGLYRGLKAKTRDTNWDVQIVTCSAEELKQMPGQMILTLGLDQSDPQSAILAAEFGWDSAVCHSVVRLSADEGGGPLIYDPNPDYGTERWLARRLDQLYRGHALRLVRRADSDGLAGMLSLLGSR